MRTVWLLFRKDVRVFLNDRVAAVITLLVPMGLILLFGFALGGTSSGPSGVRLLVVDEAGTAASARLVAALEREAAFRVVRERTEDDGAVPLTEEDARRLLRTNASAFRFAVVLPEDFESGDFGYRLRFLNNPQNPMENAMVTGLLQRAFFTELPGLLLADMEERAESVLGEVGWETLRDNVAAFGADVFGADPEDTLRGFDSMVETVRDGAATFFGGEAGADGGAAGEALGGLLDLEREQVHGRGRNPATQSIAGFASMFLLFGLTAAAISLFEERNQQILHRLLAGPVSRGQILLGKYLFSMVLGFTQVAVLFLFGHLVFDVVARPGQMPLVAMVALALSAAATGFGMILCAFTRTAAQAQGVSTLLILTMSALGGAMIPAFLFPAFLREYISPLSPVYWGMEGFLAVLWRDAGFAEVWPYAGVLLLFAAVTLAVATPRFLRDGTFSR